MAGLRNYSWAHVEKNEVDASGREFLRTAGGCRQTMSGVVMLYNLHNKRCGCEKRTRLYRSSSAPGIKIRRSQ